MQRLRFAFAAFFIASIASAQTALPPATSPAPPTKVAGDKDAAGRQAELEAKFSKMLSGATLEGSFTVSNADPSKLNREKYTLGEVKKLAGNIWQFPARIEYGGKDITLPIPLTVEWAGDTPLVVVDNVTLPGFGTVSARVLFFDNHYAGYWKHGDHTGNLFGEIRPAGEKPAAPTTKVVPAESKNNK